MTDNETPHPAKKAARLTILVVDDVHTNLRLVAELLMKAGYRVLPVTNGAAALTAARRQQPDLILLDIMMPGLNGFEVCERLKADAATRDIPVIFISALNEPLDKVKAFTSGGVDYIDKPFNERELLARISTHLSLRNIRKSLAKKNARLQREIAERERAEQRSRESEKRFAAVMNSMEAVIYVVDMETYEILFINQFTRDQFGDIEGRICWQAIQSGQTGPCPFCTNDRLVINGRPAGVYSWEFQNTVTGKWYYIQDQAIVWTDGRLVRMEIATDISRLKAVEAELMQANKAAEEARRIAEAASKAKSTFLANMSHELRTPLNAIIGFSELMEENPCIPDEEQENLNTIRRSGSHLLTLINQVLDLSKIEAGKMTVNLENIDLKSLADDIGNMFRLKIREKGVAFRISRDPELPDIIRTDRMKLRQVLINLLSNAVKFTERGEIRLHIGIGETVEGAAPSDVSVFFEVSDTGPGIAPEETDRLFEAFSQTETGKSVHEGTGLGLAISRRFVQLMGGGISVKSKPGKGSTFRFDIRAEKVEPAGEKIPGRSEKRAVSLEPASPEYRVLIVDGQPENRILLMRILGPSGFMLREAGNGADAVAVWREWRPHLIWMDVRMPEMNGYKAARKIKDADKDGETKIIAVTASVFEEDKVKVTEAGYDGFLLKPYHKEDVLEMTRRHLGIRCVYKDDQADDPNVQSAPADAPSGRTELAKIPGGLLKSMALACEISDMVKIDELIGQIGSYAPALAESLRELANDFEYNKILRIIGGDNACDEKPEE